MGSLMSGWDSPSRDSKYATLMRNKSLTKEGIEEYWKLRKNTEQEHLKDISLVTSEKAEELCNRECSGTSSLPIIDTKRSHVKVKPAKEAIADVDVEDLMKRKCWWTRSNWAFLNEPPVIQSEVPRYKYASQHHVADLGSSKPHATISYN